MKKTCLMFLRRDGEILLAMKKRSFGEGKWNGAGGKVEPGETALQAAIRETKEEIDVTVTNPKHVGTVLFIMADDPEHDHDCDIFVATEWQGEPTETEEMRPQWFKEDQIPYDQMWADDPLWLPFLLDNKLFKGSTTLDEGRIVADDIKVVERLP